MSNDYVGKTYSRIFNKVEESTHFFNSVVRWPQSLELEVHSGVASLKWNPGISNYSAAVIEA